jgi:hypothetical protein
MFIQQSLKTKKYMYRTTKTFSQNFLKQSHEYFGLRLFRGQIGKPNLLGLLCFILLTGIPKLAEAQDSNYDRWHDSVLRLFNECPGHMRMIIIEPNSGELLTDYGNSPNISPDGIPNGSPSAEEIKAIQMLYSNPPDFENYKQEPVLKLNQAVFQVQNLQKPTVTRLDGTYYEADLYKARSARLNVPTGDEVYWLILLKTDKAIIISCCKDKNVTECENSVLKYGNSLAE